MSNSETPKKPPSKQIKKISPEIALEILPMIEVILKRFIDCDDVTITLEVDPDKLAHTE